MEQEQIKKEIGNRIKSFRVSNNYTQEEFCSIINLEQPNLSNIETGKTFPDITTLCTLFTKTDMEPNYLFKFLRKNDNEISTIDYEILELLLNMSVEAKLKIKNTLELIK